ncbi:glutathione S-transferase 1-like [Achroia grisella]|uniref:glutathione S-transferase 1-like n=1 Tax=Achroia grisella TaxID=688607 RepID=UPI0027D2F12A|nr:glutathione S-transferase 1-like [Achroia grisella]
MPIVLYKNNGSPLSRAVLMTIEVLKLDIELVHVNTHNGETRAPEFLEKNPMHTVPVIEDGKFILSDSHAIITYLASKYGGEKQAELYPDDLNIRATIDQRLFFEAAVVFQKFIPIAVGVFKNRVPGPTPQQIENTKEVYGMLERYLQKTQYIAANNITVADISVIATVSTLDKVVPISDEFPKTIAWFNKLKETEFYKKGNEPGLAIFTEVYIQTVKQNSS